MSIGLFFFFWIHLRADVCGVSESLLYSRSVCSHTLHTCARRCRVSDKLVYSTARCRVHIPTPYIHRMYIPTPYIPAPTGAGCQKVFCILLHDRGACRVSEILLYSTAWYHVYILTPMYILTPYIPAPTGVGCQKVFCILLHGIVCVFSHPTYLRPQA